MANDKQRAAKKRTRQPIPPPPFPLADALKLPRLSLLDVAGFLRKSLMAVKRDLDTLDSPDGQALRPMLCPQEDGAPKNAPRYIQARPFAEWLEARSRPA